MIRLCYLVSQYPAVNHTHILREIRGLRDLGFEVSVISIRPPDRHADALTEAEREEARSTFIVLEAGAWAIVSAHVATFLKRPLRYLSAAGYAIRLGGAKPRAMVSNLLYLAEAVVAGRHCERLGLKHVHSHFSSTVALLLARVFPIGFSATIHGSAEFEDPRGFYLSEKVARAEFIRVISDYGDGQLRHVSAPEHWPKIEVIRLGVDTNLFRRSGAPQPATQVLFVGSLAPPKGVAVLIGAVDRLVRAGRTTIHLRLAGDGPLREQLRAMIQERRLERYVSMEGACNQAQVLEFYQQAGLFVLPSFAEGLPVVLMEAMAIEIPCIATRITGVPELIRHGVDGWLVPPGNEVELAAAMAQLMDDPDLCRRLGCAGRARVKEHYEVARNIEELAALYRRRVLTD